MWRIFYRPNLLMYLIATCGRVIRKWCLFARVVLYKATDRSDCGCAVDTKVAENEEDARSK